jgi:hypothetical protein
MRQESSPTLHNSRALQFTLTKNGGSISEHYIAKPLIINSNLITIKGQKESSSQSIRFDRHPKNRVRK